MATLSDEATALQLMKRLGYVIYRLQQGAAILEFQAPLKVVVGDALGPLIRVTHVDAFARDLRWERARRRLPPASVRLEELRGSFVEFRTGGTLLRPPPSLAIMTRSAPLQGGVKYAWSSHLLGNSAKFGARRSTRARAR